MIFTEKTETTIQISTKYLFHDFMESVPGKKQANKEEER
jgi:hypothetical protein